MDYISFINKKSHFLFREFKDYTIFQKNIWCLKISRKIKKKELEEIEEVKRYFSRKYSVLSKEIREKLKHLNIPQKKKKALEKELAFLPEKKQHKYLDELI